METKANYVAVGAFVLMCLVGIVVAILWLTGAQYSQEFAYYQTYFKGSVTGLGDGTIVRYNGIDVGRVKEVAFDPDDPQKVIVTLQIKPEVKIHTDSAASMASEGLTGGTYVEIDGGTKNSPLVTRQSGQKYAIIKSKPSSFQQIVDSAPELVHKLQVISDRIMDMLNDQNRRAFAEILSNTRDLTATLQQNSANLNAILSNLNTGTKLFNDDLTQFHMTVADADTTFKDADATVHNMTKLTGDADKFITGEGLAQIPPLLMETRKMISSLNRLSDKLNRQPTQLLFGDRREGYTPK
ncbi:MAG TPA: MlaD family protein [Rhizomicrobium sp.]